MIQGKSLFIYNPISGPDHKRVPHTIIEESMRFSGIEFDTLITEYRGHAIDFLRSVNGKYQTIVCSGGDGTINEIINSADLTHNTGIIFLSQGTGNDLHRTVLSLNGRSGGSKFDFSRYKNYLNIDIGVVEGIYEDGTTFQKKFCNAVGVGLDSLIAKYVSEIRKRNNFSYILSLLKAIFHYTPLKVKITDHNCTVDKKMILLSVNNGMTSGGGFYLAPDAKLDDRRLDLCFINVLSKARIILNFPKVLSNRIKEFSEVELFQSDYYKIELEKPYYLHIDGEMEKKLVKQFEVKLQEKTIKLLVP